MSHMDASWNFTGLIHQIEPTSACYVSKRTVPCRAQSFRYDVFVSMRLQGRRGRYPCNVWNSAVMVATKCSGHENGNSMLLLLLSACGRQGEIKARESRVLVMNSWRSTSAMREHPLTSGHEPR